MPIRRSSHGSRATSTSCRIMSSAACRPRNWPTAISVFFAGPAVKNSDLDDHQVHRHDAPQDHGRVPGRIAAGRRGGAAIRRRGCIS